MKDAEDVNVEEVLSALAELGEDPSADLAEEVLGQIRVLVDIGACTLLPGDRQVAVRSLVASTLALGDDPGQKARSTTSAKPSFTAELEHLLLHLEGRFGDVTARLRKGFPPEPTEIAEYLRFSLDWIDKVPDEVAARLPGMPGFDRDIAESLIDQAERAADSSYMSERRVAEGNRAHGKAVCD